MLDDAGGFWQINERGSPPLWSEGEMAEYAKQATAFYERTRRSPTFVSQREFKMAVLLAEEKGESPEVYLGSGPVIVHPAAYRWYLERLARRRMVEHFGMLDA